MSNPFLSATESWAKEREDLDAAEAAAADGYTSNVSVPVLNGGIAEMRARTAFGDELKKRKEFAASFSSASDFDENTGSFSVDSNQMTPANRVKLSSLGGSYSGSDNPFAPSARGGGKERVSFGEFTYQPDEETQRQRIQDFSTRTKWHRDFLSENIVPRLARRIGPDQSITWIDPEKAGQENYKGDRIRLGDVLPELNSTKYDNPVDDKARAKFDAILDGVYNQAGYLGLLPKSYDTGLKDNEAVAALDALGAPRWAEGTGMWRNREQSNALRERRDEGAKLAKASLDQVNYIFNTEAGWKLLGNSSWGRTGWSFGNALSTFGWDKEKQESYQKELNKSRKELDGYSIADLREYFEQAAEMDSADLTNPKARERLDYFTGLVQKRYNDMVEDRTWMGVLVDASARAATDEFVLNSWSTVRGIAGLFDSDYERDKDFWNRFAIHSEQNQTYSPEYKGDNWLLGGMQSAVELGVQQGKMAMVGLAGAGIGKGVAAARNIRQFGEAGRKIADMTDKLTGLQRLDRYADYGMRTGQWLSTAALNEADVAGQMAREYMARGLDPAEVGTGEKLALTAWYTGLDGMFNPFIKGMRTRVPGMRGMVGPDPTKILPPIWAGKGNMLKTVGNWIKAVGKDTAFEVGQEAAQQAGSNIWSAGRFGTVGMKSQGEVRDDGTTDWSALWKNYKDQSIDIFWGTVFGAGGGAYGRARAEAQHDADVIKKLEAIPVREFARQGVELSDVKNLDVGDRLNLYEALRNHSAATAVKLKLGVAEAAGEQGAELADTLQKELRQLQANNAALYNRATAAGKSFLQRLNERTSGSAQVEFGGDNAQLRQDRENNRDSYQLDLVQLQASRDEQVEARKMLDKKRGDKGPLVWGEPDGTDSPTQMRFVEEHDEDGNITEINIQNNKDVREPGGRPLTISRLEGETNDEVIGRALELAQELANYHADLSLIDQDTAAFAQQFLKNLGVGDARIAFYSSTEDLTARIQEARKQQIEDGVPEEQLISPSAVNNDLVDQDGKVRMDVGGAEFGNTVFIRRGANQTVGEMIATLAHEGAHVEIFNEAANLAQDGEAVKKLCEITGEDPRRIEKFISDLEELSDQDRILVLRGMLVGTDGAYEAADTLARVVGGQKVTAADKEKLQKFRDEARSREETLAYTEQVEWNNPEANAKLPGTKWYQRAMTTIRHPMRAKQYYDFKAKYPTMDRVTQAVLSRFIGGGEVDADTAMNFIGALHQREGKDTDRAPQILMGAMGRPSRAHTATESLSMLVGSNLSRMTDFERGQLMSAMVRVNSLTNGEDGLDRAEALNRVIKELIAAGGHNAVVNEMLNQLQDESVLSPVALTQFVDASRAVEKYQKAGGDRLSRNQKIGNIDVGVIGNKEKIKPIETKKGETEATAPTEEPAPTATEEAPAQQESVPAPVITTNPSETPTGSTAPATPAAPATETPAPAEATAPKGKRRMGKAKKPPETTATPVATEAPATTQEAPAATPEAAPKEAAAPAPAEPEPTATPVVEIPAKVQTAIRGAASRDTGSFKVETASAMLREAQKKGADSLSAAEDALREFAEGNGLTAKFSDVEVTDSKTKKKVSFRTVEFVPQKSSTTQDQIVASEQDEARAALEAGADARLSDAFKAGEEKLASEKDKIMAEADALGLDVEFVDRRSPRNESIIISPVAKFSEKGANEVTQRKFEGDTSPVITDSRKDELRRVLDSGETRDGIELVATEEGLFERQKRMGRQRIGKIGEGGVVQGPVDPNDKVELGSNATPRIVPEEERRAPKLVRGVARVLNLKDISKMEIKLIPADLQKKFAQAVKKTKRHKLRRTGDVNTAIDAMLMDAEDRGNIDALKDEIRALAMKNGAAVRFHQYTSDGKVYTESIFYPRKGITADQHKGGWLKRSEINGWLAEAYERGPEALLQAKEAIADIAAEEGWEVEFVGAGEDGSYEAREAIFHPQGTSGVPSKNLAKDEMPKRKLSESEVNHLRDYYKRDRKDAYLGESASIELIESVGDKESLAKAREGLEVPKKKSLAKKSQTAKKSEEAPAPSPEPEKPKGKRRMGPAKKATEEKMAPAPAPESAPAKATEKKGKTKTEEKTAPAPVKRGLLTDVEKNTLRAFAVKGLENLTDEEKGEYLRINAKNMKEADAVYKAAKGAAAKSGKEPTAKPAESKAPSKETRSITPKRVDASKILPQSVIEGAETARSNIEYNDEAVKGLNTRQKWDRFWRAGAKEPGAGAESTVSEDKAYDLVNSISGYNNAISVASDAAKPDDERSAARDNIQKFRKAVERIVGKDVAADLFAGKDVRSSLDGLMKTWDEMAEKQGVSGIRRTTEKGSRRAMIGGKTNARERQEAKMRRRMGKRFTSDEAKEFRKLLGINFANLSEKQAARLSELEKKSPADAEAIRNGGKSWMEARLDSLANKPASQPESSPAMTEEAEAEPEEEEEPEKPKRRIGKKITGAEELQGVEKYRMMLAELSGDANPDVRRTAANVVAGRIEDEIAERESGRKSIPSGMREFLAELQEGPTTRGGGSTQGSIAARDSEFLADLKDPGDRSLAELLIQHRTRGDTAQKNTSGTVIDDIKSPAALAALIPQLEQAAAKSPLAKNTKMAKKAIAALPKGAATYARLLDQAKRKWRTLTGESSWNEARAKELGYDTDIGTVKSGGLANGELWLVRAAADRQAEANAGRHMLEDVAVNKRGARGIGSVGEDVRDADDYEVRQGFQQSAESALEQIERARAFVNRHIITSKYKRGDGETVHDNKIIDMWGILPEDRLLMDGGEFPSVAEGDPEYLVAKVAAELWNAGVDVNGGTIKAKIAALENDVRHPGESRIIWNYIKNDLVDYERREFALIPSLVGTDKDGIWNYDTTELRQVALEAARGGMQQSAESEQAAKRTRADDRADAKAASFRERFPLMAVHGLSISSLKSALDAGAFVMPSTAVALKDEGWTQAGFVNKTAPGTDSEVEDFYADPSEEEYKRYLEGSAFVLVPKAALQNRGELYTGDAFTPTINALLSRAAELGLTDEETISDESIEEVRREFDRGNIETVNEADIESTRQRLVERKKKDEEMAAFEEAYGEAYDELYPDEEEEHDPELDHFDEGKIWRRMPIGEATAVIIDKAAADYDRSLPNGVIAQLEKAGVKIVEVDTNDNDAVVRAEQENAEFFQSAASEAESRRKPGRTLADDGRWIFGMRKKDINERIKERGDDHMLIGLRDGHRKITMDESFAMAAMKTDKERDEIVNRALDASRQSRDCLLAADEVPVLMAAELAAEFAWEDAVKDLKTVMDAGGNPAFAESIALAAHGRMNELIKALGNVKGSAGRALNIHKSAMFSDFSFAGIASEYLDAKRKATKDPEEARNVTLTKEELERAKERADEFAKYRKQLEGIIAVYGEEQAVKALDSLLRTPRKRRLGEGIPKVETALEKARKKVEAMEEAAPIDLADWEGTYGAIQDLVRNIGDAILGEFKKENPLKHMGTDAFLDRLKTECDKVFGHLTASDGSRGGLTREEYRDLYTDADQFGKHPPAPEDPVRAEIRRMLNATHMIYELEAVKKDPKQFPIDRYNAKHGTSLTEEDVDTEIERLKREHDAALRASGLSDGGPDAKTMPLDVEKMRVRNRIEELRHAIENHERIIRETRQPLVGDEELADMKRELADLQRDYAMMESSMMTDEEKLARLEQGLEKRLESRKRELERLNGGASFNTARMSRDGKHYLTNTKRMDEVSKQISDIEKDILRLRARKNPEFEMDRYAAKRIMETKRRIDNAKWKREQYALGVDPSSIKRKNDYQGWRLRPEAREVLKQLDEAQELLERDQEEFIWKQSSKGSRAFNRAMGLVDTLRTYRASGDISGLGVQLAPYLLMHPEMIFKRTKESVKSLFNKDFYDELREKIKADPRLYTVLDKMGVKLTDIRLDGLSGGKTEDVFRRQAGARWLGAVSDSERNPYLAASERGFNSPIVMARWEMATAVLDHLTQKFGSEQDIPPQDLKTAGRLINAMTGKGDLFDKRGESAWKNLLWAPGRLAGQIQTITLPLNIMLGNTPASDALKSYIKKEYVGKPIANAAKLAAALWLVHMLLKDDDDDDPFIEIDPTMPQFGKVKIGKRFFSILGGEEAMPRLITKVAGDFLPDTIGRRDFYGNEASSRGNMAGDTMDTIVQFARGRLNPALSGLLEWQQGKKYTGETIDKFRMGHLFEDNGMTHFLVFDNLLPLSWTDVYDVVMDGLGARPGQKTDAKGVAGIVPLTILALAGVQGQNYGDTAFKRYEARFDKFAEDVADSSWLDLSEKRALALEDKNQPFVSYPGKFERLKKLRSIIKEGETVLRSGKETAPKGKKSKRVPLTTEEHDYAQKQLEKFQAEFVDLIESDRRR